MKINKYYSIILILTILLTLSFSFIDYSLNTPVSIASWNLNVFGDTKANNQTIMSEYYNLISKFDIIFLQEIRDIDGSAIVELCEMFKDEYNCINSSRAGSESYKEQYVLIYNKNFELITFVDYNLLNYSEYFFRPPIKVIFNYNDINFTIYGIHIKPDNANEEIKNLESIIENENNIIVLGDLNADCSYYSIKQDFNNWYWSITQDTTVSDSNCIYDNILINDEFLQKHILSNVYTTNISKYLSDHYLIYSIFEFE